MGGEAFKSVARRLQVRAVAERGADSARLLLDSVSDPVYQPVRELGRRYVSADRAEGTTSRWNVMRPVIDRLAPSTALDVGCNAGWFTLALGRLEVATLGVEGHPPYYRAAITAVRRSGLRNVGVITLELDLVTMRLLPTVDCTLFLSVWHHIVRADGLDGGSAFLRSLWEHTKMVMFFETGESEEFACTSYGLPEMRPDPAGWLHRYLSETCEGSDVEHLGMHPSGPGSDSVRNLFAVQRPKIGE
jgi:hypothetical protein